ncbi:MAG: DUF87 domain-containing protein [Acidobacteriota bacterium]
MNNENYMLWIGERDVWGGSMPFGISNTDLRQHCYIIGKSGAGKTTLLRNIAIQHIENGGGLGLLDPHGDLAEELLDLIPRNRTEHVLYFNPADLEYPVGLNLLANVPKDERYLVISGIVGAFKAVSAQSWGERLAQLPQHVVHFC